MSAIFGVELRQSAVDGAIVGTLGTLGKDLAPIALGRGLSFEYGEEDASSIHLLAVKELFAKGNECLGIERQVFLSGIHVSIIVPVRTRYRRSVERLLYPVNPQAPYPASADGSLPLPYRRSLDPLGILAY